MCNFINYTYKSKILQHKKYEDIITQLIIKLKLIK